MSLCQANQNNSDNKGQVSCGSCCGLFNLDLNTQEYKKLLRERTEEFNESVDFQVTHTMPAYRQSREKKEESLTKKDDTTYNCPFLGYLDSHQSRIGCMIHPVRTGNPKSQNFSFYGSSICLGYECRNKENANVDFWEKIFAEVSNDSIEYSQLSANYPLVRRLEKIFGTNNLSKHREEIRDLLIELIQRGLVVKNLTSFEVDYLTKESIEECMIAIRELKS
jgi:hypothetical protein